METKAFGIQSPESLAKEYGGNKQKIAKAVQLGILDPTAAVLAGMFIDRVRNAAQEEQGPQTTIAQQVLGGQPPAPPQGPPPAPPQGPPPGPPQAGLQAAAPPPMRMAYGGQVGVSNNQLPAPAMERGLDGIPIPDNMFDYADGGMVAFGSGGDVQRFAPGGVSYVNRTPQELRMLLQAAQSMPDGPEKANAIQAIQAELPNAIALESARSNVAGPTAPAAAPTATPPAAGESMLGRGINLNTAIQNLMTQPQFKAPDISALQAQAKEMYPDVNIAAPDRDRIATEQLEAAKKFGYDPNLVATQKKEYETERENLKGQRDEAANMALLTAGLKILGGTSPFAAVNIGKGASEAVQEFGKDIREIQKLNIQLRRDQQALERAANQDALQRSDKTEAAYRDALARKEAAEQKVLDRRASTFNSLLQGEYGNLREMAQQTGANLRQVASTLGSLEQVERTTAAYGGDRRSEYARATDTNYAEFKRLRDAGDPEYADKSDTELMVMASDKTQRQMRQAAPREMIAGAAASRADTEREDKRSKLENRIRLMDRKYKDLIKQGKTAEAEQYLQQKVDENLPKISTSANRSVAPAAARDNPLELNLPGR